MRPRQNPYEGLICEDGISGSPLHPFKDLFKRNGLPLCDVAFHTEIGYTNLVAWLNGYGSIGKAGVERLRQFARAVEIHEQQQEKKRVKFKRTKGANGNGL